MTGPDERFVEIFRLIKAYPNPYGEAAVVVDGFSLIMRRGEAVSVIGHSGCGKSTVLTMVAGLNPITRGSVAVAGREIDGPGPDRAVVFQSPCLLPWMTAYQNVLLGVNQVYPHATKAERRQICEHYLHAVGLASSMHRYPRELSGGMQQRVGIARAIALKPRLLLLDEPFGRLDSLTRMELQDVVLRILDRERITTMIITHDVDEALYMSDRVCMMTTGPNARVGQLLDLPFARPRVRTEVLEDPLYYDLRGCLVSFLEQQDKRKSNVAPPAEAVAASIDAADEPHAAIRGWSPAGGARRAGSAATVVLGSQLSESAAVLTTNS
ncbi:MAG: nitrate ABC transporter ATP-binding protein [Pirellulales bacterium]|nr:nitrate ABC transporter ATP-binding protein [Pirellulales bacterium]